MDNLRRYLYYDVFRNFEPGGDDDHRPRLFHDAVDPFEELSNDNFIKVYRLTKERVSQIIDIVAHYEPAPSRRSALDVRTKVLTALRFFATGSYQLDVGLGRYSAVSQPSVSRSIHTVIDVFNRNEIFAEYVRFYRNIEEVRASRDRFWRRFQFPNAIGCIDGTHVAIVPPKINDPVHPENVYVNRKGYHSLNVQLICDAEFKILNVNARYPGSANDCAIWNDSNIQPLMRRLHNYRNERFYLLGDAGYPLRPWLMTPFRDPLDNSPEAAFNRVFCRARSIIERVNGILKMRWRCLLKHRVLHYDPTTAAKITNTCVVLHNMAIMDGLRFPAGEDDPYVGNEDYGMMDDEVLDEMNMLRRRVNPELAAGRSLRDRIVRRWFT
ncbi:putative nuclease HARBI1 [Diachasma alloeum]|uniref:putative nuclease HARBI1 n=2 Tax=Diachasma alloeum TaxID=454923 RepID=UPI0007383812|nr:putative nuclease HARBI1 [Diachasma alloeum]